MCVLLGMSYLSFSIVRSYALNTYCFASACCTYDDITRPIAIYNKNYKFFAYPYSVLQEFTVDNKVIVTSHHGTVRKLHASRTRSDRVLKRNTFITYELDILWDPDISSAFIGDDLP